jgi:serine/threonine-protein kinase
VRLAVALVLALACGSPPGDDTASDAPPDISGAGPYFTQPMFWNQDVSALPPANNSSAIIQSLRASGGWGNNDTFQIDFSMEVLGADDATPMRDFTTTPDFYSPDCDHVTVPVPAGGNLEGESGYACAGDGDCHLIVFHQSAGRLYEMWRANIAGAAFLGGCLAVWNTLEVYSDTLRGDQCTSADAAGFPIAPLLFTADEVAAGEIDHAIRFILPNDRVRRGYVRPATHGTNTTGGANAPAYGVHLRLRADYPVDSLPSAGARTVARALQKYGMYHADGGNIALTAMADTRTTAKWSGLLAPRDLSALDVEDFAVIDHGAMIPLTFDCMR